MNIKTFVNFLIFIAEQVYEKKYLSRRRPAKAQASRLKSGFGAVSSQKIWRPDKEPESWAHWMAAHAYLKDHKPAR